jgi:hypothetical protein
MKDIDDLTIRQLRQLGWWGKLKPPLERRRRGRPTIWGNKGGSIDRLMHIWIAIEIARKGRDVYSTVRSLFGHRNPRWLVFVGDEDEFTIKTPGRALKLYYEAQKLLKSDPELCCRWAHNLELAKRLTNWRPKIKQTASN